MRTINLNDIVKVEFADNFDDCIKNDEKGYTALKLIDLISLLSQVEANKYSTVIKNKIMLNDEEYIYLDDQMFIKATDKANQKLDQEYKEIYDKYRGMSKIHRFLATEYINDLNSDGKRKVTLRKFIILFGRDFYNKKEELPCDFNIDITPNKIENKKEFIIKRG